MSVFGTALKWFAILFSFIVGLFLLGLGLLSIVTNATNMKMEMFPFWKGDTLWYGLVSLGLLGVLSAVLAVLKKGPALLVLFTLLAFALTVYGYFISPAYRFTGGPDEAKGVLWFAFGLLGAFFGSLYQFAPKRRA